MLWFILISGQQDTTLQDLNTSYVMVHPFKAILSVIILILFKYILCYGSSQTSARYTDQIPNLNTSYVMVHPGIGDTVAASSSHLNTSYVMVHQRSI